LFLGQLKNLHKHCLTTFKSDLLSGLRGPEYDFAEVVLKAREKCERKFSEGAKEAVVEQGGSWVWEEELELLKEEMKSVADTCRKDETKKMVNLIEVSERVGQHVECWCELSYVAKLQETDCGSCGIGTQQGRARYVGWNSSDVQGDAGEGRENIPFKSKECAVIDFHFMSLH
jgi:hypothetical protein